MAYKRKTKTGELPKPSTASSSAQKRAPAGEGKDRRSTELRRNPRNHRRKQGAHGRSRRGRCETRGQTGKQLGRVHIVTQQLPRRRCQQHSAEPPLVAWNRIGATLRPPEMRRSRHRLNGPADDDSDCSKLLSPDSVRPEYDRAPAPDNPPKRQPQPL